MTDSGVIPRPQDRKRRFTRTGEMDAGDTHIVFGAEGDTVVVMCDGGDIALSREQQDRFAREYFRAVAVAEVVVDGAPF